jgi:hypothetical protein
MNRKGLWAGGVALILVVVGAAALLRGSVNRAHGRRDGRPSQR